MSVPPSNPLPTIDPSPWPLQVLDRCLVKFFNFTVSRLAASAQYLPSMRKRLKRLQVIKDIPFGPHREHTLDLYAPPEAELPSLDTLKRLWRDGTGAETDRGQGQRERGASDPSQAPYPFALYLHGGGFVTCSKDSHWTFGVRLAEAGLITLVVNYRLSIDAPCPAALEDCATSLAWALDHADALNLDVERGMIAGESAGGNLTLALTLCLLRRDRAPWASAIYDRGWTPKMIAPACAFLDVSSAGRLPDEMHPFFLWRIQALGRRYLTKSKRPDLGEPLSELVDGVTLDRPCPPVFIPIGDNDPVYRDSMLLAEELTRRHIPHRLVIYPRGIHAFHAAINTSLAERCWRDHLDYWRVCDDDTYEEAHVHADAEHQT